MLDLEESGSDAAFWEFQDSLHVAILKGIWWSVKAARSVPVVRDNRVNNDLR